MSRRPDQRIGRSERMRYRFDDFISKGSGSIFVALLVVFLAAFIIIGLARVVVVATVGGLDVERGNGGWRQLWLTFLEITDPGSMTQDITSSPWIKAFAVVAGMVGIVLLSALIAFITTTLDQRLGQLRKGHSRVVLEDHTLILGWNDRMIDVLEELILANESEDNPAIVVLSNRDKEEMDDELSLRLPDTKNTKVVTRSGAESDKVSLKIAAAPMAKSVIVLARCNVGASERDRANSDLEVVRALLGLTASTPDNADVPIIAEIFGARERLAARTIDDRIICVDAGEILAKILVQTSRSEGLSVVYEELLSFDGAEIYLFEGDWDGQSSMADLSLRMVDGVAIGISDRNGHITLNPPADQYVRPGDSLVVVATDDSLLGIGAEVVCEPTVTRIPDRSVERHVERELIVGWNESVPTVIREYADYVMAGSRVNILLRFPADEVRERVAALDAEIPSIDIELLEADPFAPNELMALRPFTYDNVIIVSQASPSGSDRIDAETLLLLLQLQGIFREHPETTTKLIAELLDSQNRDLIAQTGVREFIISNRVVSMIVAQLSEEGRMGDVYDNLFAEDGSEVYLKPATLYVEALPQSLTFADLMGAASLRGETAIGWRSAGNTRPEDNFGITLIPPKDTVINLDHGDTLVVVAEDET